MITSSASEWPALPWAGAWPASQAYLHLVTQMMGKLRLALSPSQPEWLHTSLALGARGLTTGAVPWGAGSAEVTLDLVDGTLAVLASEGASRQIALAPGRPIAAIWTDFTGALRELGVAVTLKDRPHELADRTPLSADQRERTYDRGSVASWFRAMTATRNVLDEWRSPFPGRTGVQFWWGSFDLTAIVFNSRRAKPREGAEASASHGPVAEYLTIGFWPGDERNEAMFFGYIVPEPAGCERYPLHVPSAGWVATMGEWVLPYEAVRTAADPARLLRSFMERVHAAAGELAGWDISMDR